VKTGLFWLFIFSIKIFEMRAFILRHSVVYYLVERAQIAISTGRYFVLRGVIDGE
jgi:hypothetical protein